MQQTWFHFRDEGPRLLPSRSGTASTDSAVQGHSVALLTQVLGTESSIPVACVSHYNTNIIYIYIYRIACARVCVCVFVFVCVCACACACACACVCVCVCLFACLVVCLFVCSFVRLFVCLCVCVSVCFGYAQVTCPITIRVSGGFCCRIV